METPSRVEFTGLLQRWSAGESEAAELAMALVYEDLHRLAEAQFRVEQPGHTVQATALISEAFGK